MLEDIKSVSNSNESNNLDLSEDNQKAKTGGIPIASLTTFYGGKVFQVDILKDNIENEYKNVVTYVDHSVFRINGEYSRLSGRIFRSFNWRANDNKDTLKVYGDGILLATEVMEPKMLPFDFEVDLTDVIELEIEFITFSDRTGIADFMIYPK